MNKENLDLALGLLVDLYAMSWYGTGNIAYETLSMSDLGEAIIDMEIALHS